MESVGFKEWSLVCDALGRGEQSVILRKGGIAEGREGFSFRYREFFLFPLSSTSKWRKFGLRRLICREQAIPSRFDGMRRWSAHCGLVRSGWRRLWLRCTSSGQKLCENVLATKTKD